MNFLKEAHYLILQVLNRHSEGLPLQPIKEACNLSSVQNTYQYLKALRAKELVKRERRLYFITQAGKEALLNKNTNTLVRVAENYSKSFTPAQTSTIPTPQPQAQRYHALKAHAKLAPTSYSRAEATLASLNIPYRRIAIKPAQFLVLWQGIRLKITSKKVIASGREINAPINVPGIALESLALNEIAKAMASFIDKTGLRVQKDKHGEILIRAKYREFAFTNSEVARKATERGGWIPLAFDRLTGSCRIWADNSITPEFETNTLNNHAVLRKWTQAIEDKEIDPYMDEMLHRAKEDFIKETLIKIHKRLGALEQPLAPEPMDSKPRPEPEGMSSIR